MIWRRLLAILLLGGLVAGDWMAPAVARTKPAATMAQPLTPAVWKASSGKATAYLFGTVHALPRGVDWFSPRIAELLDQSSLLVLETSIPDSPAALTGVLQTMSRQQTPSPVTSRVPKDWQPALQSAIDRLKPGPLAQVKTWAVALRLANLQARQDGLDPRFGAEAVLAARAHIRKIPIHGLETAAEQLRNFDVLPEQDQQLLLMAVLADLPKSETKMRDIVASWLSGDTQALSKQVNAEFEHSATLRRLLLTDRNARWAAWIAEHLQTNPGPIFIAVGAGHLSADSNLIEQLELRGVGVERMTAADFKAPAHKPAKRRSGK